MQTSSVNPLGVYDSSTALWLQGKGQQDQTEQQKLDKETGQSTNLLAGRTEEFNRRLREQPADTQLWIQFIQYQVGRLLPGGLVLFCFSSLQQIPGQDQNQQYVSPSLNIFGSLPKTFNFYLR